MQLVVAEDAHGVAGGVLHGLGRGQDLKRRPEWGQMHSITLLESQKL